MKKRNFYVAVLAAVMILAALVPGTPVKAAENDGATGNLRAAEMRIAENGSADRILLSTARGELKSSVVIKGEDTPEIEVDGIGDILEDNENVVTSEDKADVENGLISIEIILEAEKKEKKDATGGYAINKLAEKDGLLLDLLLDLSLKKVTTQLTGDQPGEKTTSDVGSANQKVLEIAIPYDTPKIGIRAFRYHDGRAAELNALAEKPDSHFSDGTFYVGTGYVYIYASGFSTYGLAAVDDRLDGPPAPAGLTPAAPTSKGANDGKIAGVAFEMEYSVDDGVNWTPVTAAPLITNLAPGKVLIRYAGTDTVKPGASAEVTVPDYSDGPGKSDGPPAPGGLVPVAPTSVDGTDGKVTGADETMEYSTDGGNTWKPVVGTGIMGLSAGTNVTVRVKETATTKPGATITVVIPYVYSVTVTNDGHGTAIANPAIGTNGATVILTATPSDGYEFDHWEVPGGDLMITDDRFTIGTHNVEIRACFKAKTIPTVTPSAKPTATTVPTATETPSATPASTATATLAPTDTPIPTATEAPANTSTPAPTATPIPIAHKMIRGMNQTIFVNASSAVFASNAPFEKFSHVLLDGEKLAKKYYKAESGSTVITLNEACIRKLSVGKHKLTIVSSDGSATAKFVVEKAKPKTGDATKPALLLMLLIACTGTIVLVSAKAKKRHS